VEDTVIFAKVLHYDNPFKKLMKETDRKVTKLLNMQHEARDLLHLPDRINGDLQEYNKFIEDVFSMQCYNFERDYITECECLQNPSISLPDTVRYLLDYCQLWKAITRQTLLKEKLRSAILIKKLNRKCRNNGSNLHHYAAPIGMAREDILICGHAFKFLFCIGRHEFLSLKKNAMSGIPGPVRHGNINMPNRSSGFNYLAAVEGCKMFLQELQDQHGEAMATRLVRETVSSITRADSHITHLPSSYTKRKLYGNWCYTQGWIVCDASSKGNYGKIDDYKKREIDEEWTEDSEYSTIVLMRSNSSSMYSTVVFRG